MGRFECPDCHLSGNESDQRGQPREGGAHPDAGALSSSLLPLPAVAFVSAAGVTCILANGLLAASLLRARGSRSSGGEKALVLKRRIRGLILNLALADLLTVALLAPFEVFALSRDGVWDFGAYLCRLFLGAEVLLGSAASYALAALALHAVHFWLPWPFVSFSWLLSVSLSVPVFVLADVVSLPSSSPLDSEPQAHCSLPLALVSGSSPRAPDGGSPGAPLGILLLRLTGASLGFVMPTLIVLVSNVEAVVSFVRGDPGVGGQDADDTAVRQLEDESFKLCFVLSLTHILTSFPRFAYSLIFLVVPEASFLPSSALRIPPLVSPPGFPSAFFMSVLHYAAPAIRPAIVVATSATLRKSLFSTSLPAS